jgi:hypothetical protein
MPLQNNEKHQPCYVNLFPGSRINPNICSETWCNLQDVPRKTGPTHSLNTNLHIWERRPFPTSLVSFHKWFVNKIKFWKSAICQILVRTIYKVFLEYVDLYLTSERGRFYVGHPVQCITVILTLGGCCRIVARRCLRVAHRKPPPACHSCSAYIHTDTWQVHAGASRKVLQNDGHPTGTPFTGYVPLLGV